jgi:presenilin-like A22 family membrane protease
MKFPISIELDMEGTPVAIATLAVGGIIAVSYAPVEAQTRAMAFQALGNLAGGAVGVAMPRLWSRPRQAAPGPSLADYPASFPAEFGDRG